MILKLACLLITNIILFKITYYLFNKYELLDIPSGALKIHDPTPYNWCSSFFKHNFYFNFKF